MGKQAEIAQKVYDACNWGSGFRHRRWIDDTHIQVRLSEDPSIPVNLFIEVDPRYEVILEMEEQAHKMCDKLRELGQQNLASQADSLASELANLPGEL